MVKLSLCVIPSRAHSDGSLDVKIKVTNKGSTAYIQTPYKVDNLKQWKNGMTVRRGDVSEINIRLMALLMKYRDALEALAGTAGMTASEIKRRLETYVDCAESIKEYAEKYIDRLKRNNKLGSAKRFHYTLNSIIECFGERVSFQHIDYGALLDYEQFLFDKGYSKTTANIRMTTLAALINSAINNGLVEYKVNPFRRYRKPEVSVRDICLSKEEFQRLSEAVFSGRGAAFANFARDMFMLSFYCAGINLPDLIEATLNGDILTFVRKKTANRRRDNKEVSLTLQPEALEIIKKYIGPNGKLNVLKRYRNYGSFSVSLTGKLSAIGKCLNFEKPLMYYSARKTFCQFGYELGVPLYVLEYAIGHTIKDESHRPIFSYIKIMRKQADSAVRMIIDYALSKDDGVKSN